MLTYDASQAPDRHRRLTRRWNIASVEEDAGVINEQRLSITVTYFRLSTIISIGLETSASSVYDHQYHRNELARNNTEVYWYGIRSVVERYDDQVRWLRTRTT